MRYLDDVVSHGLDLVVAFGDYRHDDAVARLHFLNIGDGLVVEKATRLISRLTGRNDDDGQLFIDQGIGAVLHFPGRIAFGMNVRYFLQLESPFQRDGELNSATQEKKVRDAMEFLGESFELRVVR